MMKILKLITVGLLLQACNLVDPTEVDNPNVTEETFLELPRISTTWEAGLERQLAITMNQNVVLAELLSDNYFNNRTLTNKVFDIPQIDYTDIDVLAWQSEVHRLRAMAEYALEVVTQADETTTAEQRAAFSFYLGLAHLFSGQYFTGLPAEEGGEVVSAAEHYRRASDAFQQAFDLSSDTDKALTYSMAQARTEFYLGNRDEAVSLARSVVSSHPLFLRQVAYDQNLQNDMQFYLFDSEANEFAPLPRLDFLDPKYFHLNNPALERKPIALFKAEEAYLILAEAALANGDVAGARNELLNLLTETIAGRPSETFSDPDNRDGGTNINVGIPAYPLSNQVKVLTSPQAGSPQTGLILERPGLITIPTVSGTSVTANQINAASTVDELLEIVYLMRQEVFMAEGIRVVDLGIKVPVAENEFTANEQVTQDDLQAQVPTFFPDEDYAFDNFEFDAAEQQVVINYNLNRILVENKSNPLVIPLF
jgi:tetratricopeptide (TPR) repeat protein